MSSPPPTMMGSITSASDERVAAAAAAAADDAFKAEPSKMESDRAKKEKRYEWIGSSSLDDVVFHETEWVQLGRDAKHKTRLQRIKGYTTTQLTVLALKKFCTQHRISGWKDKQKHVLCELIVNAAMYPDGDAMAAASNDMTSEKKTCKKKKKKSKKSKPEAVRQEGTLYRVINTLVLQKNEKDLEKHALDKAASLAQLLNTHQESLAKARDTLRALMSENDYDSDSELANEAKMMIDLWTIKRDEIMADFKCHSTNVASKPMQRRMLQNPPEFEVIGSSSSSSESSSTESFLGSMASEKQKPRKKRKPLVQKNTAKPASFDCGDDNEPDCTL
jgi:hypothetical protein